jgi:hypothetical protein
VRVQLRAFSIWRALEAVWLVDDQTNTPVAGWNLERLAQGTVDRLDDVRPARSPSGRRTSIRTLGIIPSLPA